MRAARLIVLALAACCLPAGLRAQQWAWSQYSVAMNYESFGGTYGKAGYTLSADMDVHWRGSLYASLLAGVSRYDGSKEVPMDFGGLPSSDNLADSKTQILFGMGPGIDLLSNNIDRFYLSAYAGYAIVKYTHAYYDGKERYEPDDDVSGFMALARLGYEHQVGNSVALGLFAQVGYAGKELNWGIGIRVGFRTSGFRTGQAPADYTGQ